MLKESETPRYPTRRTHRTYTPEFKAELVKACKQPGASIAALALQHGMNANVLHRWLKEHRQGMHILGAAPADAKTLPPAFIPLELATSAPLLRSDPKPSPPQADIRIEFQHHAMKVSLHWPMQAARECAQMLRELLQ